MDLFQSPLLANQPTRANSTNVEECSSDHSCRVCLHLSSLTFLDVDGKNSLSEDLVFWRLDVWTLVLFSIMFLYFPAVSSVVNLSLHSFPDINIQGLSWKPLHVTVCSQRGTGFIPSLLQCVQTSVLLVDRQRPRPLEPRRRQLVVNLCTSPGYILVPSTSEPVVRIPDPNYY